MNNKGFAVTGIIYSVLLIFLVMMTTMLFNLQNRKTILDELKLDAVDAVESENNYDYLLSEINTLKAQIGDTDISGVGDGTITGSVDELNNVFISDTDWIVLDETYGLKYRVKSGIVFLQIYNSSFPKNTTYTVTTLLPENVRPLIPVSANGADVFANIGTTRLAVKTDGTVILYSNESANAGIMINLSYPLE